MTSSLSTLGSKSVALPTDDRVLAWQPSVPSTREDSQPRARPAEWRVVLRWGLALFAVLIAALAAFLFFASRFEHDRGQVQLEQRFRAALREGRGVVGGDIAPGTPVALLQVPALGLHEIVVEGTSSGLTEKAPGHVRATPFPGQRGNAAIAARRTSFGAPFRDLDRLVRGDRITVTTAQGRSQYEVTSVDVAASDDKSVFRSDRRGTLTLLTSDPPVVANQWLFVRAQLTARPKPSTPHPGRLARDEVGLTGETGTLPALVLWLQVLLVVALGATWLARRWSRWSAYVVAVPLLLATLWIVFDQLARLLPATL